MRASRVLAMTVGCFWLGGCGSHPEGHASTTSALPICSTAVNGADASRCPVPGPSYANDVAPILDRRCNRTCHTLDGGAWPLIGYADVSDWSGIISADLCASKMPPPDAGPLPDEERATIVAWVVCGALDN